MFRQRLQSDPARRSGFEVNRSLEELHLLSQKSGWTDLEAVRTKQVYVVDYDLFTQPSASTLTEGIELLAALFHSELFTVPDHLKHKFINIHNENVYAVS